MPEEISNPRTPDDDSLIQGGNWLSSKLEGWRVRVTPSCTEMTHLISEEMDHPLPLFTRMKMRAHFLFCCYCERYKKNLHALRRIIRAYPWMTSDVSGEALSAEDKNRLKQVLRDES